MRRKHLLGYKKLGNAVCYVRNLTIFMSSQVEQKEQHIPGISSAFLGLSCPVNPPPLVVCCLALCFALCDSQKDGRSSGVMEQRTIIAGAKIDEPFMFPCVFDKTMDKCPDGPGVNYDLFDSVMQALGLEYKLVQAEDNDSGYRDRNGKSASFR